MKNQRASDDVVLSVSSVQFKIKRHLLNTLGGSLLSRLDEISEHYDVKENVYSFDRDPELFRHILNAYRIGEIHIPRNYCPFVFKKELQFWEISLQLVAPCCWRCLYDAESSVEDLKLVIKEENDSKFRNMNKQVHTENDVAIATEYVENKERLPKRGENKGNISKIWLFLDEPRSSTAAKVWLYLYLLVVVLSVVLFLIWLVPSCRVSRYLMTIGEDSVNVLTLNSTDYAELLRDHNENILMARGTDPHPVLFGLDLFCIVFFSFEFILSVFVCPNKWEFFQNPNNWVKIIVCATMTIALGLEFDKDLLVENNIVLRFAKICRALACLRLLLIFRLRKIFNSFHILLLALKHSTTELFLLLFTFLILVVIYASLMFSAEIESETFASTQLAMWWAVITMTTVGYGDFYPVTTFGYIVGVVCAINGIIVIALPVAAIAGKFNNLFSRNSELQRHKTTMAEEKQDKF